MRQERHDDRSWLDTLAPLFRSSEQVSGEGTGATLLPSDAGRPSDLSRKPLD